MATVASSLLGCIRLSVASRSGQVTLSLCSALVRHLCSAVLSSGLPSARQTWTCWKECKEKVTKMVQDRISRGCVVIIQLVEEKAAEDFTNA